MFYKSKSNYCRFFFFFIFIEQKIFYFFPAITVLIFTTTFFGSSFQQQNLCGTNQNVSFVADPSTCHTFLRCHDRDSNGIIARYTYGSCYLLHGTGSDMFRGTLCTANREHCENPLLMCPPATEPDIRVIIF